MQPDPRLSKQDGTAVDDPDQEPDDAQQRGQQDERDPADDDVEQSLAAARQGALAPLEPHGVGDVDPLRGRTEDRFGADY